jgi:hypothetical protein
MRLFPIALMLPALAMAGCKPTTIVAGQPEDNSMASNTHVSLPPPISHSGIYRCDDNTLAYIDYLADGLTANLKFDAEAGTSKRLTAEAKGKPFAGEGFSVSGDGSEITMTKPGAISVHCAT